MVLGKIDLKKSYRKNTLKYCFTYKTVNNSNPNGALTSSTASIIGSRSNSKYPSKNYLGGTIQIRVVSYGGNSYYYVCDDFYSLP